MNWIRSYKYILLLMLITVLVRLPNLNRPLSKHHEFNPAVMLINAESWEEAGGASKFGFTPLMNFQGYANKVWDVGPHVDSQHNHLYLSYGSGAFVLPYLFFKIFHVPPSPLWLQMLNLLFSLWGTWLFYRLIIRVTGNRQQALLASCLYALLPAVLWYTGNGYVNTAIMLPIIILVLMIWHRLEEKEGKVGVGSLGGLLLCLVLLTWLDWFSFFLGGTMAVWALLRVRRSKAYLWTAIVATVSVAVGIFLVLYQLSIYAGWQQVLEYWRSRFVDRSTDTSRFSFLQMAIMCAKNLVSGYLPAILLVVLAFFKRKEIAQSKVSWPVWAVVSVIPYNLVFFNWSAEHEFAWLAFGLVICAYLGISYLPTLSVQRSKWLVAGCALVSLAIYFVINRPGDKSWRGDEYASQMRLGNWIQAHVDTSHPIFTNLPNDKITEYYSGRTFNAVKDRDEAIKVCVKYRIPTATWLDIQNNKVVKQVLILM